MSYVPLNLKTGNSLLCSMIKIPELVRKAKEHGIDTLSIVNVVGSSIARESKYVMYTKAGCEIAVATTKAYLAQVTVFGIITMYLTNNKSKELLKEIENIPTLIEENINKDYSKIFNEIYESKKDVFFIGRGIDYAICMEGALKLKEISYINASAYQAGELKHGTISLIDNGTNVIAIVTDKNIADKTISNIKEVKSRGAVVTLVTTNQIDNDFDFANYKIVTPSVNDFISPMVNAIPLQLIGYETAKLKGCDIDKPKNLAKSVTVE